jgi:hypothetical protein
VCSNVPIVLREGQIEGYGGERHAKLCVLCFSFHECNGSNVPAMLSPVCFIDCQMCRYPSGDSYIMSHVQVPEWRVLLRCHPKVGTSDH